MGFWSRFVRNEPLTPATAPVPPVVQRFEVTIDPVMLYGTSAASTIALSPRVSRREAVSVPAVKRARDLIAGSLGSLPLNLIGPDKEPQDWSLFAQPEADVPRSITFIQTFEDLLFEQVAWWRIVQTGWHNKPVYIKRLDPTSVTVNQNQVFYQTKKSHGGSALEWIPDEELIRFDGPNDPLLVAGARAIRASIALDAAALNHANGVPPLDYFTPAEGADPADDEDILDMLDAWQSARQARSTGYVPAALKYNFAGWNPEQLQMAEARQHAVLEIARLTGIDPEDLGVSTTSRTYQNSQDRYAARIKDTLRQFAVAVEDRLSMNDVSPRGYTARFDFSDLLRSDDKTRMEVHQIALAIGAETKDEMRDAEHKPALTPDQVAAIPAPPNSSSGQLNTNNSSGHTTSDVRMNHAEEEPSNG